MPTRRPLPALIALLALLLLTALVWWRVLHRGGGGAAASNCPTQTPPAATLPAPSQVTVRVLNATNRNGIASRARTTLASDGFNIPLPAANDRPKLHIHGVAQIRFGPSGAKGAQLLHYYFPGARMVPTQTRSATVVVSLGEKYRSIVSASSVDAQLRQKQIQLETGTPGSTPSNSASC